MVRLQAKHAHNRKDPNLRLDLENEIYKMFTMYLLRKQILFLVYWVKSQLYCKRTAN